MTRCFEPREIARALDLPEGDPGRRHLDSCPRCRSLALAYYEFMESPDAKDVEFSAADRDLQARLAEAFTDRHARRRRWWRVEWPKPVWASAVVALAAAAVLLLAGDLGRVAGPDQPSRRGALRGADPVTGLTATRGASGLSLAWETDPAAGGTVIVLYDEAMNELGQVSAGGTRLVLGVDDPLAGAAYLRLLQIADGDTVARSTLVAPRTARE